MSGWETEKPSQSEISDFGHLPQRGRLARCVWEAAPYGRAGGGE